MTHVVVRLAVAVLTVLQAPPAVAAGHRSLREAAALSRFGEPQASSASVSDSTLNGVLIGAAVGGGAVLAMVQFSDECRTCAHPTSTATKATAITIGAVGGAAIGYLVDRAHHQQRRIAVAPTVSRHTNGMRVILRF
jgi:hypothetical protein